jgi:hypothetical protein
MRKSEYNMYPSRYSSDYQLVARGTHMWLARPFLGGPLGLYFCSFTMGWVAKFAPPPQENPGCGPVPLCTWPAKYLPVRPTYTWKLEILALLIGTMTVLVQLWCVPTPDAFKISNALFFFLTAPHVSHSAYVLC